VKEVDVIIPIFNCEPSLEELLSRLKITQEKVETAFNVKLNIVAVDDGSSDNSVSYLENQKLLDHIKLIKLTRNFGARQAVNSGISISNADAITFIAADLQDPPEIIFELIAKWKDGHKFVIATRDSRKDPFFTKLFAKSFYFFFRKFVIPHYPKGGFDIALLDKELLSKLLPNSKFSDIKVLSFWLGYKPCNIKVSREKRRYDKSSWTFNRKIELLIDILLGFGSKFMRKFILFGLFFSASSLVYTMLLFISYIFGYSDTPKGFNLLLALLINFFGIIIILLSLCLEYLIRILNENNKRPEFVIERVKTL
jgi:dolichol-phosphate mannosyltransferase